MNRFTLQVGPDGALMQQDANGEYVRAIDAQVLDDALFQVIEMLQKGQTFNALVCAQTAIQSPTPVPLRKPFYAPPTAADKALLRTIQEVRTTKQPNPVELDPFVHVRVALKNYKDSCLSPPPTVKQMRLEELAIETAEALTNFFKA